MSDEFISLKEYFENKLIEFDKRFEQRFTSQERALQVSVENTEKALNAAKNAQDGVNSKGNEFRASLEDYQKNMVSRHEFISEIKQIRESVGRNTDSINALQVIQSHGSGEDSAIAASKAQRNWAIGLGVVISIFLAGSIITLIYFLGSK
jgi:hypothetical protein